MEAQGKYEASKNVDIDLSTSALSPEQVDQVKDILTRMSCVFKGITELGNTSDIAHDIRLTDGIPIRDPYWRVPPAQLGEFRLAVQDLLEAGVIRESTSPYASPVVLVWKKDGTL